MQDSLLLKKVKYYMRVKFIIKYYMRVKFIMSL